jgi:hypothetical protein
MVCSFTPVTAVWAFCNGKSQKTRCLLFDLRNAAWICHESFAFIILPMQGLLKSGPSRPTQPMGLVFLPAHGAIVEFAAVSH